MGGLIPLLLLVLGILSPSQAGSKHHRNKANTEHTVIFPYKSDQHGNFISHDLHHLSTPHSHHHGDTAQQGSRLYYRFSSPHGDLHLDLEPSPELLAPGFAAYKRNGTMRQTHSVHDSIWKASSQGCLHHGSVVGRPHSTVALNTCHGMTGYIDTGQEVLLIQPLPHSMQHSQHARLPHSSQPHQLSHHSDLNTKAAPTFCGHSDGPKTSSQHSISSQTNSSLPRHRQRRAISSHEKHYYQSVLPRRPWPSHGSPSRSRTLETLVVVDNQMLARHGEANVTTYVLTILNMVSKLFHDNSIGSKINVTLVALILLEGDEVECLLTSNKPLLSATSGLNSIWLKLGHHADESLNNFCQWQTSLEGVHHDHAILLTGLDICSYKNSPCDTLGFAPIHGMCKRHQSCTINEDTGLGTAFTIAHEAGHNLGMFHDGEGNYCSDLAGSIMAPTLAGHDGGFKWSACSRKYLKNFLRSGQAWCLADQGSPLTELSFPDKLPGEMYDVDTQCQWQFGLKARVCWFDFAKDICRSLWCFTGGARCETKFLPAAEGTVCGYGRWCRKGVCVEYGDDGPPPVHGGWSEFSPWTSCTRTCGRGVMFRQRRCNNPIPMYGGADCDGESRMYKLCNLAECPPSDDFRTQQCASFNSRPFRGWYYKWTPYTELTDKSGLCRLYCQAEGYDFFFAMSEKVTDGTPCEEGSSDVCIEGSCMTVGCDNIVDSGAKLDLCGVCQGDNSTCRLIQGQVTETMEPNAYHRVVVLPRGARSIVITEKALSASYLVVRMMDGEYFINGNWHVTWPGRYKIADTYFQYTRSYDQPEQLRAPGPLDQEVIIELLVHGDSPGLEYQYTLPKVVDDEGPHDDVYQWVVSSSECSVSCAGGERLTVAHCMHNQQQVEESYCDTAVRPTTGQEPCNTQPCPPRWVGLEWSGCSRTCGGGIRRRRIVCMQQISGGEEERIRQRHCHHLPRLERRQACNTQECPPQWRVGDWSQCSVTCGSGLMKRSVECTRPYSGGQQVISLSQCTTSPHPATTTNCSLEECPQHVQWFLSAWGQCSQTCGVGTRERTLRCSGRDDVGFYQALNDSLCSNLPKPNVALVEKCENRSCKSKPDPDQWFVSPWSKCSVTCGQGQQTRVVKCGKEANEVVHTCGQEGHQPDTQRNCYAGACPDSACEDLYTWCHMVPKHDLCRHEFYNKNCCAACQKGR